MRNLDLTAEELFNKVRSRFSDVTIGDEKGNVTSEPKLARFVDFDYNEAGVNLGRISISLDEKKLSIIHSSDIVATESDDTRKTWYGFLKDMRNFAKQNLLQFDIRDITKSNLEKRDYQFLAKKSGDNNMTESKLFGTSLKSYQAIDEGTRLIISHSKPVNTELAAGRTMHIENIHIENSSGERFRYPFKHLNGARAMARHVANGGTPYDDFGSHIVGMSEELSKLRSFKTYCNRSGVVAEGLKGIKEKVIERIDTIKDQVSKLQRQVNYESIVKEFQKSELNEVPEDIVSEWVDELTIKTFKEDLKDVFPYVYRLLEPTSISYEDIEEGERHGNDKMYDKCWDGYEKVPGKKRGEKGSCKKIESIDDFESSLEGIIEDGNSLFSSDEDEAAQAKQKVQELVAQHFPAGVDGMNAVESLQGIIDDPMLTGMFKDLGKKDSDTDVRTLVNKYIKAKNPELLNDLDFGDMKTEGEITDKDASMKQKKKANPQEVSEFILSHFDRENGTFPKGETGVLTSVEKDFGEEYVEPAKTFIEKIQAKYENYRSTSEIDRIKELSGIEEAGMDLKQAEKEMMAVANQAKSGTVDEKTFLKVGQMVLDLDLGTKAHNAVNAMYHAVRRADKDGKLKGMLDAIGKTLAGTQKSKDQSAAAASGDAFDPRGMKS
jgi:hypothetical protein